MRSVVAGGHNILILGPIAELTAEYLRIDVAESARKWVEYCRANNKPMTREKLNGWLKRERPAKSQSGLSKAELMARINVEIGKLRTISPVTFDDLSQIVRQRLSDLPKKWHDLEPDIIKRALGLTRSEVPVSLVRVGDKCQGVDWKPEYEQQAA